MPMRSSNAASPIWNAVRMCAFPAEDHVGAGVPAWPRAESALVVHPGNKEFVAGDRIARPEGGSGGGGGEGEASDSGEGEDDFVFQTSAGRIPGISVR